MLQTQKNHKDDNLT